MSSAHLFSWTRVWGLRGAAPEEENRVTEGDETTSSCVGKFEKFQIQKIV
jgi:hypothetical protein